MTRTRANLLLLLAGATWGMGFIAQSTAMDAIGPYLFVALRFLVASLAVLPFAIIEMRRANAALTRRDHATHALVGLVFFLGMAFQQVGLLTTTVTNSGFLTGLYVLFTPLLGIALFREWPHPVVWPAVLVATGGVYLLSGGNLSALTTGDVLTVICAVFWGLQIVLIARFVRAAGRPVALALTQFAVCAALAFLVAVPTEEIAWDAIREAGVAILYAGIIASALAFTVQIIAQAHTTAPQAAIFLSSEALFAALFGAALLGERMGFLGLAGCALIFAAMVAVEVVPALRVRAVRAPGE